MSRARGRKEQQKQDFLDENPNLISQPELIDLSTYDLQVQVGIASFSFGDFFVPVYQSNEPGAQPEPSTPLNVYESVEGEGTVVFATLNINGALRSFEPEEGILGDALNFNPQNLGLSGTGLGVLSEEEFANGDENYLADGFDTIEGNEVLAIARTDGSGIGEGLGFNFLVEGGSGTVHLVFRESLSDTDNPVEERFSVAVDRGDTQGSLAGLVPDSEFAFIGVTGDLEITVTGIGMNGDFAFNVA